MAKNSTIRKNQYRKNLASKYRNKRSTLSSISKDTSLSFDERLSAQIKLSQLPRNSAAVRFRNRCSLTGRPRGVYRKFSLSRNSLRELASWGCIPGLVKSSW